MSDLVTSDLITVAEAVRILDADAVSPRVEEVSIRDCVGRRLARAVLADRDFPPFDKSLMDGYALRSADVSAAGVSLNVIDQTLAGMSASRALGAGEAVSIMTGAPMPAGADAVVPVEKTRRDGDRVLVETAIKPGQARALRGSDCAAQTEVLAAGTVVGPVQLAIAASVGASTLSVYARPRVNVFSTGDELVAGDQSPGAFQIRNSNGPMIGELLRRLGCEVTDLGIVRDDVDALRTAIVQRMNGDALFITGGMSMGERDYIPALLRELGLEMKISKLRMKPGKPFVFARNASARVFGLPGNPVSAYVCALRLAGRIISRLAGGVADDLVTSAKLLTDMEANGPREFYVPAWLDAAGVRPLKWKGSADIFTLSNANALIIRSESAPAIVAAEMVGVLKMV